MLRADRIQRDVSMRLEQVSLVGDVLRREAAAEEVPVPVVPPVEPLRIGGAEASHARGERRLRGVDDEMEVRAHQAIRLESPLMAATDVPEVLQELTPVFGLAEQKLIAVCTSGDVMKGIGQVRARFAGHLLKLRLEHARLCGGSVTP